MTQKPLVQTIRDQGGVFCYIRDTAMARAASLGDVGRLDLVLARPRRSDMLGLPLVDKVS